MRCSVAGTDQTTRFSSREAGREERWTCRSGRRLFWPQNNSFHALALLTLHLAVTVPSQLRQKPCGAVPCGDRVTSSNQQAPHLAVLEPMVLGTSLGFSLGFSLAARRSGAITCRPAGAGGPRRARTRAMAAGGNGGGNGSAGAPAAAAAPGVSRRVQDTDAPCIVKTKALVASTPGTLSLAQGAWGLCLHALGRQVGSAACWLPLPPAGCRRTNSH